MADVCMKIYECLYPLKLAVFSSVTNINERGTENRDQKASQRLLIIPYFEKYLKITKFFMLFYNHENGSEA